MHHHGQTIAVVGYGSQGRAHAQNLADSGRHVIVGLRPGSPSRARAREDGLDVADVADAVARADVVAMLLPDAAHRAVYDAAVEPRLADGALLVFAHGFNVHFGVVATRPGCDVVLVAPKGPGNLVRERYLAGDGVPCLFAVHTDATGRARDRARAYAEGIGARGRLLETTFAEETETDLFGEQAVLCGGVTALVKAAFETLVDAGYQPEVAYLECLHELKLITDLLQRGGIAGMRDAVSEVAKFGDVTRGPRVIDERVRRTMRQMLCEVRDGTFAREWLAEDAAGRPRYNALLESDRDHLMERVGRTLRRTMNLAPLTAPAEARP